MSRLAVFAILVAATTVLASFASFRPVSAEHSNNLISLLAIDANVQGNTATSIGTIDGCARVEPGAQIEVDYVVDAIPEDRPIMAMDVELRYDPGLLEIVGVRHDLMLASVGDYQPFDAGDSLPNADDSFHLVVLDTASQTGVPEANQPEANVERGKGVLARITLQAKAPGLSAVSIGYEPQGSYPLTLDSHNETIIVDKIGGASIAIGQDCPSGAAAPHVIDPPNTEAEIAAGVPAVAVSAPQPDPAQAPDDGPPNSAPADAGIGENASAEIAATEAAISNDSIDAQDTLAAENKTQRKDANEELSSPDRGPAGQEQNTQSPGDDDNGGGFIAWALGGLALALALSGGIIFLVMRNTSREIH